MMLKNKEVDIVQFFLDVLFAIFATIFIIQLLMKIFGGSPTETALLYGGFSAILVCLFTLIYRLGKIDQKFKLIEYRLNQLEHRFNQLDNRLNHLETNFGEKLSRIEKRLTKIETKLN